MYSLVKLLYWNKPKKMFLENAWKIPAKKNHVRICFSKILLKLKLFSHYFWNSGTAVFKKNIFFLKKKSIVLGQAFPSDWREILEWWQAINAFILEKIEKLLELKAILKIHWRIKERKLVSENLVRTLKSSTGI